MQYLAARWLAVKAMPDYKIKTLHRHETAVYNYARFCRKNYPKDKTVPPLWWQCTFALMEGEFRKIFSGSQNLRRAARAGELLKKAAGEHNIDLRETFSDINLMHRLDMMAKLSGPEI